MKIGIDGRLYSQTGVGRYIRNLIKVLGETDKKNKYLLFLRGEDFEDFKLPNKRWRKIKADVRWHSVLEQVLMPVFLYREKIDLVHFPYFNVPVFYFRPFVITIHDLTHLHFDTGRASTLPYFFYKLKRLGMRVVLKTAVKRARRIIAVSKRTKREIIDNFKVDKKKIKVIYEGVDKNLKRKKETKRVVKGDYILYVGNAYPHKNLERLMEVFKEIKDKKIKLVLVGPEDFFYKRLKESYKELGNVIFWGLADDEKLTSLYSGAKFLILPSLAEGFGLVGLEAMSLGCPVLASKIAVLKEIYGGAAEYFNPEDKEDLRDKIEKMRRDKKLRRDLVKKGRKRVKKFSWGKMGRVTYGIYEDIDKGD